MKKNLLYAMVLVGLAGFVAGLAAKRVHENNLGGRQPIAVVKQGVCDQVCDPDRSSDLTPLTRLLFKAW